MQAATKNTWLRENEPLVWASTFCCLLATGPPCCWFFSLAVWFSGALGLGRISSRGTESRFFMHHPVMVATVWNYCQFSCEGRSAPGVRLMERMAFKVWGSRLCSLPAFLWILWERSLLCTNAELSVSLKVQTVKLNYFGFGPSGFNISSFLCGIQMSLVPW